MSHKVECHLVVRANRRGKTITGITPVAMRIGRPSLRHDEAAVRVVLDVPDSLFDPEAVAFTVESRKAALGVAQEEVESDA